MTTLKVRKVTKKDKPNLSSGIGKYGVFVNGRLDSFYPLKADADRLKNSLLKLIKNTTKSGKKSSVSKGKTVAEKQKYYESLGWKFTFLMSGNGLRATKGNRKVKGTSLSNVFSKL